MEVKKTTGKDVAVEVTVARYAWEYMLRMGRSVAPNETGGLLRIEQLGFKEGRLQLYVAEATTPPQEVTRGTVEWEAEEEVTFLQAQGLWATADNPSPAPVWGKWHTHPGMGVFWSSTDEATLVKNGLGRGLLVNLVLDPLNAAHPFLVRVDSSIKLPGWERGESVWVSEIPATAVLEAVCYDGIDALVEEATKRCVTKEVTPIGRQGSFVGYHGYSGYGPIVGGATGRCYEPGEGNGWGYWERRDEPTVDRDTKGRWKKVTSVEEATKGDELQGGDGLLLLNLNTLASLQCVPTLTKFNFLIKRDKVTISRGGKTVSCDPMNRIFGAWFRSHFPLLHRIDGLLPKSKSKAATVTLESTLLKEAVDGSKQVSTVG